MFVETANILLEKVSDIRIKDPNGSTYIELLIKSTIVVYLVNLVFEVACKYRNQLQIIVALTKLLVKYDPCRIHLVLRAAKILLEACEMYESISFTFNPYREGMEMLGNIFRYIMLAHADRLAIELQDRMNRIFDSSIMESSIMESFIYIAGYSSKPGRSKKLLRIILSAMNARL